jgi:hypothetical protein
MIIVGGGESNTKPNLVHRAFNSVQASSRHSGKTGPALSAHQSLAQGQDAEYFAAPAWEVKTSDIRGCK